MSEPERPGPGPGDEPIEWFLERIRRGDEPALDEFLTRDLDRLRALAAKILRDFPRVRRHEETEDLTQSLWIALRKELDRNPPRDWLHYRRLCAVVMRHLLIDLARRYRNAFGESAAMSPDDSTGASPADRQVAPSTSSPERMALWVEFHERAGSLTGRLGEVFDLLYYQDLTQAEAARLLGLQERVIRHHYRRAREVFSDLFVE